MIRVPNWKSLVHEKSSLLLVLEGALVGLLVLAAAPALRAQFQDPTPEELKMTSDPKAPGAAAVYLNIEEVTDDPTHFHSYYARIKVLQEKGKELATVDLPYFRTGSKVVAIKARTIHADGTIVPLEGKPDDLLMEKAGHLQFNHRVFNLPAVEVGSILEYRYEISYGDNSFWSPDWEIQQPYFVHKAHYGFTPFEVFQAGHEHQESSEAIGDSKGREATTLLWWAKLPPGSAIKTDAVGRYSIDLTDIPPTPNEEWMPPFDSFRYKAHFYYTWASDPAVFWEKEAKSWSKDVDRFAEPSKPIKEAVAALVGASDSGMDKARKLYKAVQALDNTDFSRRKTESERKELKLKTAKRAEDTLAQKSGSSNDLALLYLAMLRAAGLKAYGMRVVDRTRGVFAPGYLYFDQLNDEIVVLSLDGKDILLDPGQKMCPFAALHWKHSSASGIRQAPEAPVLTTTPVQAFENNKTLRMGDMTIAADGGVTGTLQIVMSGQEALRWRQLALLNDPDEVKKQFDSWLEQTIPDSVAGHVDHFISLDNPDTNLMAVVNVQGHLGTATAKRLLLPGLFFETRGHQPFVSEAQRLAPVDMSYGEQVTDKTVYHLPAGLSVEGAPQDTSNLWKGHAELVIKTQTAPGQITTIRQLSRAFTLAKPEEYQDLRGFYQKVAASDQQQLVLSASAPGKGQ